MPRRSGWVTMCICIGSLAASAPRSLGQTIWSGPDGGSFKDDVNWTLDAPGPGDTGIHETNTEIRFDEPNTSLFMPYDFAFYQAQGAATTFTMGAASPGGSANALRLMNGLFDRTGFVNHSVINVGSFDGFLVGDPLDLNTTVDGDAKGYKWVVGNGMNAPGIVGITGTLGPGTWIVNRGFVAVGIGVVGITDFGAALNTTGTIDSGVTTFGSVRDSVWTIDGLKLKAKTIRNLDDWTITRNNELQNDIHGAQYFELRKMSFAGQDDGAQNDWLRAGEHGMVMQPPHGLRVLDNLEMFSTNPATIGGGWADVSELVVGKNPADAEAPEAVLSIREATKFFVFGEGERTANPEFRNASTLQYGAPSGVRPPGFAPEDPTGRTLFDVFTDPSAQNAPGVVAFKDQSYITAIGDNRGDVPPPAPGELRITHGANVQDMQIHLHATSLAIESPVGDLPARDWYTGDVDLFITKNTTMSVETISPDSCNLWFTNLPEPRCVKYWRNISVQDGAIVAAVDRSANYDLSGAPDDKGLYVVQSLMVGGNATFTLNDGVELYYGVNAPPNVGTQLAFTEYGDFDVSCGVDITDYTSLPFHSKTYYQHILGPEVQTDWPVSDYDGDCDIDLVDFMAFQVAFNKTISNCPPNQTLVCPTTGGIGGLGAPLQGGGSPPPVDPWTYQIARVTLEIQPVGGGVPLAVLAPNTEYELHYNAAHSQIHGYTLWSIAQADGQGMGAARAPERGSWSRTDRFQYLDLAGVSGGPVEAPGYPPGSYRYDQVSDGFSAGRSGGPSGYLGNFVTESSGELNLHLYMWNIDIDGQVLVEMNDQIALRVRGR